MKKLIVLSAMVASSGLCLAQEVGRVISSTPILQQVAVPRQICTIEQVAVRSPKTGAGALMGAIAGGAVGNAIGQGSGRAAATVLGVLGGAALGDSVEGGPGTQTQDVQRCTTQNVYENRAVAYNVVYEYAGRQYSAQLPSDPGPTIQLQVTPVLSMQQAPPPVRHTHYRPAPYGQPGTGEAPPPIYAPQQ